MAKDLLEEIDLTYLKMSDSVKAYLQEIKAYPILSIEEQKQLAREKKYDLLIQSNLRLVVSIAAKYYSRSSVVNFFDLIQEGNLGLITATREYDPEKGAFSTYAFPWIKQRVLHYLAKYDSVFTQTPEIFWLKNKYQQYLQERANQYLGNPTKEEVCEALNITEESYYGLMNIMHNTTLDIDNSTSDGKPLYEVIEDKNNISEDSLLNNIYNAELIQVLRYVLSPVEYYIIYNRILRNNPITLTAMGSYFNVTHEAIRKRQKQALDKIKDYLDYNSAKYRTALKKIKQEKFYGSFKVEPIEPGDIVNYLYVANNLNQVEKNMLQLSLFGQYNFTLSDYARLLHITLEEARERQKSLNKKLEEALANYDKFVIFKTDLLKKYGMNIYNFIGAKVSTVESINRIDDNMPDIKAIQNVAMSYYIGSDGTEDKEKKREFNLFLKSILSPLDYFIIYNCVFKDEPDDLSQVANYLNSYEDNIYRHRNKIMAKLREYLKNNQRLLKEKIAELKDNYGTKYNLLNDQPVEKATILQFLFLKYQLTEQERAIYALELFSMNKYSLYDYAQILHISLEEVERIYASLQSKIMGSFVNDKIFARFASITEDQYKILLYRFAIIEEPILKYNFSEFKQYTLDELINYFHSINYDLSLEEIDLLEKYLKDDEPLNENTQDLLLMLDLKKRPRK